MGQAIYIRNESRYVAYVASLILSAIVIAGIISTRGLSGRDWLVMERIESTPSYSLPTQLMIPTDRDGRLEVAVLFKPEEGAFRVIREVKEIETPDIGLIIELFDPEGGGEPTRSNLNDVSFVAPKPKFKIKPLPPAKCRKAFFPIIDAAAQKYSVDPDLVKAVIMAESNYNPEAVSNKGARGLMQLMPETAIELGVEDPFNPEHNIFGGVKYLKRLLNHFQGDVRLAVAAYNAGIQRVMKYRDVPPFKATQYYVEKVIGYYQFYKQGENSQRSKI